MVVRQVAALARRGSICPRNSSFHPPPTSAMGPEMGKRPKGTQPEGVRSFQVVPEGKDRDLRPPVVSVVRARLGDVKRELGDITDEHLGVAVPELDVVSQGLSLLK